MVEELRPALGVRCTLREQRSRFDSGKGKPSIILWSNDVVRLRPCSLNLHRQKMRVDHEKFIVRK